MRLVEFEGKYLRLHIPSGVGFVRAERVYWLGGRVISIWYHKGAKRGTGRIFLSYGSGRDIERVKSELKEFVGEGYGNSKSVEKEP
jgi:hypothetical protein